MRVKVNNGNATVHDDGDQFHIIIPSKKNILIIMFLIAWLGGWAMGETVVISILMRGAIHPFLVFWLCGWTVGGIVILRNVSWMLFGKEVISSDGDQLTIEKCVLMFKSKKEYDVVNIKNIRAVEQPLTSVTRRTTLSSYGLGSGVIHFDYGMKTIQFAINIDVAEANHLIESPLNRI